MVATVTQARNQPLHHELLHTLVCEVIWRFEQVEQTMQNFQNSENIASCHL